MSADQNIDRPALAAGDLAEVLGHFSVEKC